MEQAACLYLADASNQIKSTRAKLTERRRAFMPTIQGDARNNAFSSYAVFNGDV
jgi:hypothetical protein